MNKIRVTSKGNLFQSGAGGVYRVNDGDPQNDVDIDEGTECYEPDWDALLDDIEHR